MEDIFTVKSVPWVSEKPIDLKEHFDQYSRILAMSSLQEDSELSPREAIRKCFPPPTPDTKEDPFDVEKLEEACSPDLLTVKDELLPWDISKFPVKQSGRFSNWYTGTFKDPVIPEGGTETLHTLAAQAQEHHRRERIADYASLRHRNLKYFHTVRLIMNEANVPEPTIIEEGAPATSLDDIVINVRVHRPYHRRIYYNKVNNSFPKHSQELLLLGSQKLTELRDNIICINNLAVGQDLSPSPNFRHLAYIPNAARDFPSGFIYINGVFYNDMRCPEAKDYSAVIKKWAEKRKEIGPMVTRNMEDTCLKDLKLRLGYPYVFVHLGNCEHILVFTDARLHHRQDVQDPLRYPISWGQPIKLAAKCHICSLNLANWITKGDSRLPLEYSLLCERCLKAFCYDSHGKMEHSLKVYPFMDEFVQQHH